MVLIVKKTMKAKKKIEKPVVKNEYTNASKEKLDKGIKYGNNEAIAEKLRRAGI